MKLKTLLDYYDEIHKEFPYLALADLRRILSYGWKQMHIVNLYGGDVLINNNKLWVYVGKLRKDSLKHHSYYTKKMINKLRFKYLKNKILWDGYYYFTLGKEQYAKYKEDSKPKRGRPRTKFTFYKIKMFKLKDECTLNARGNMPMFRIPMTFDLGFSCYYPELKTDKAEFLGEILETTLRSRLTSNYDYSAIMNPKKHGRNSIDS